MFGVVEADCSRINCWMTALVAALFCCTFAYLSGVTLLPKQATLYDAGISVMVVKKHRCS